VLWMVLAIDDQNIRDDGGAKVEEETTQPVKISQLFKTPALTSQTIALMVMTTVEIAGYFGMMNWLPTIIQTSLNISVKDSSLWMVATIL
ncbi:MFS transporter, partial [Streptococcus salivarius]|nr:MFS transporter [Streptococcus salivarius]